MTKVIDIVKPAPKTEQEAFERWENRMASELLTLPYYHKKIIEVKTEPEINCSGRGRAECVRQGEHSWFNHSQDNMSAIGNLPEGYIEP